MDYPFLQKPAVICERENGHKIVLAHKEGTLVNADVNGGLNILRKQLNVVCDDIICPADRGLVLNPLKINFHKNVE